MTVTFADLTFEPHPRQEHGFDTQARVFFPNGYGASVITGRAAYGPYEVAVLLGDEARSHICYVTDLTDDTIGGLTPDRVTETLAAIAALEQQP